MSTRSKRSVKKENDDSESIPASKPVLPQKVFLFDEELLENAANQVIQKFYHPGKEENTFFIVNNESKTIQEVISFDEPNRCWFINQTAHSNGCLYMTVPVDPAFLVLHYLKNFCKDKALQLDQIEDAQLPKAPQILSELVDKKCLEVVADVKTVGGQTFYKYNPRRTIAWLQIKVSKIVESLKNEGIYCGYSSLSANYAKSEKTENTAEEEDFLRVAVGIVGQYLDLELLEDLKNKFGIKEKKKTVEEEKKTPASKRKSVKLEITSPDNGEDDIDDEQASKKIKLEPEKPKEKKVTAKEEKLAKAAKGSKSISSFFTKK
ncbi:RNASEH2B family protein [Megaselia abdita]